MSARVVQRELIEMQEDPRRMWSARAVCWGARHLHRREEQVDEIVTDDEPRARRAVLAAALVVGAYERRLDILAMPESGAAAELIDSQPLRQLEARAYVFELTMRPIGSGLRRHLLDAVREGRS